MIEQYLQLYKKAKENRDIKACYLGVAKQFRIISRDSYISTLTDPEVMLEYVLYPQYCEGNIKIKAEVLDMMFKIFGEIPFVIFDKKLAKMMKKKRWK